MFELFRHGGSKNPSQLCINPWGVTTETELGPIIKTFACKNSSVFGFWNWKVSGNKELGLFLVFPYLESGTDFQVDTFSDYGSKKVLIREWNGISGALGIPGVIQPHS